MKLLIIARKIDSKDSRVGFFTEWVKEFEKQTEKLIVITWQESNEKDIPEGVKLIALSGNVFVKIFKLKLEVLKNIGKVDGVFTHMNPEYAIIAGAFSFLFRKKLVHWYTHKSINMRRRAMELMVDTVVTASEESFRKPLRTTKVKVLGHGIPINKFPKNVHEINTPIKLLSVSRISPSKDIETMIKSIDLLQKNNIDVRLTIVGSPALMTDFNYMESLEGIVKKLSLEKVIIFEKDKAYDEIPFIHAEHDIFINMSTTGSLDKAVLEAMASGMLIITSNEAFKNIIPEEWMVKQNNTELLVDAIGRILKKDKSYLSSLKEQYRTIIEEEHALSGLITKITKEYK